MGRKFFQIMALLLMVLSLTLGAARAEKQPFGDKTEVYYRVNLNQYDIENVIGDSYQRLYQIEMLNPYFNKLNEMTGFNVEKDLISWMGNRIQFGIVGLGRESTLREEINQFYKYKKARNELKKTESDIRRIRNAVEEARMDTDKLPATLKGTAFDEQLAPPRGGKYIYRVLPDDQYEITVPAGQFKDLGLNGNAPHYHSENGFTNDAPVITKTINIRNWLLAVEIKNNDNCRLFFEKLERKLNVDKPGMGMTFKKQPYGMHLFRVSKAFSYTFQNNLVLISDNPKVLETAVTALERDDKSINANPVFKACLKENPGFAKSKEMLFVDMSVIRLNPELMDIKDEQMASIVSALYYTGYAVSEGKDTIDGNFILALDPSKKVPVMDTYFADKTAFSDDIFEKLPAGIQTVTSYNVGEIWSIFESTGKLNPKVGEGVEQIKTTIGMASGLDFDKDIMGSITGELAITYKIRDLMLSGIMDFVREATGRFRQPSSEEEYQYDEETPAEASDEDEDEEEDTDEDNGDEEMNMIPGRMQSMLKLDKVPFTFFLGLKQGEKMEQMLNDLVAKEMLEKTLYNGATIYNSQKFTLCLNEDLLMIHTTPSHLTLKKYIDTLNTDRKRLGANTRYRDFKKDIKGRMISLQYHDTEWSSSMLKGLMLLILPEFSDYAEKVGEFQETWTALSVTPRGIHMNVRLYAKEKKE